MLSSKCHDNGDDDVDDDDEDDDDDDDGDGDVYDKENADDDCIGPVGR